MSDFAVGHRVVVRPGNAYDDLPAKVVGIPGLEVVAGHFGRVVAVGRRDNPNRVIRVRIAGHVRGPAAAVPYVMATEDWHFRPDDLEHAD